MAKRILCAILLVAVAFMGVLVLSDMLSAQSRGVGYQRAKSVQEKHTPGLMAIRGVEGTAV